MAARRLTTINLLPKTEFETSFWGKFLKWSIGTGRYIVILTELVVIAAFLSRFKLDRDFADLADRIGGKKAILTAMGQTEKRFLSVQDRINTAGKILDSQLNAGTIMDKVINNVPEGINILSLQITPGEAIVSGKTNSEPNLEIFLGRINKDNFWKSTNVTNLNTDQTGDIRFTLKLNF